MEGRGGMTRDGRGVEVYLKCRCSAWAAAARGVSSSRYRSCLVPVQAFLSVEMAPLLLHPPVP